MRARATAIAEWAGVEAFLDSPLRTYSSGMLARLGFAVATDVQPHVLLVDEVLSVGDADFQRRSKDRIRSLIHGGAAVVLVSHAMDLVEELADSVTWLDQGQVRAQGPTAQVLHDYRTVG